MCNFSFSNWRGFFILPFLHKILKHFLSCLYWSNISLCNNFFCVLVLLFLSFLFEKFDITLIPMKPVDQSHIRAASFVTERDCIGPNWSRLWALLPVRPLSRLTSEIVSTQLGCGAQLKRCEIGLTSLSGGRDYPRKKVLRCHAARRLR